MLCKSKTLGGWLTTRSDTQRRELKKLASNREKRIWRSDAAKEMAS